MVLEEVEVGEVKMVVEVVLVMNLLSGLRKDHPPFHLCLVEISPELQKYVSSDIAAAIAVRSTSLLPATAVVNACFVSVAVCGSWILSLVDNFSPWRER